jgi:hypothetical protein
MKYFFSLLIAVSLFGCLKKEESPCPLYVDDVMAYSPLVFSFIAADSTNLLENKTIDTTQISIKDEQGNIQKFSVFLDSTSTKARYISVPILQKQGTNELKISVNNKETSLKYDFAIVTGNCGSYHRYDNYALNGSPYKLQTIMSYSMYGNQQKTVTAFRVIYITD